MAETRFLVVWDAQGNELGRFALAAGGRYVVGRDPSSDIHLAQADVSRQHAALEIGAAGRVVVTDLNSSGGTFVDDERVDRAVVDEDDVLGFASTIAGLVRESADGPDGPVRAAAVAAGLSPEDDEDEGDGDGREAGRGDRRGVVAGRPGRAVVVGAVVAVAGFALLAVLSGRGIGPALSYPTVAGVALALGLVAAWFAWPRQGRGWSRQDTFAVAGLLLAAVPVVGGLAAPPIQGETRLAAGEVPPVENLADAPTEVGAPGIQLTEGGFFTVQRFSGQPYRMDADEWNRIWSESRVTPLIAVQVNPALKPDDTTVNRVQHLANIVGWSAGQCRTKTLGHFVKEGKLHTAVLIVNGEPNAVRVRHVGLRTTSAGVTASASWYTRESPVDVPAMTSYFTILQWPGDATKGMDLDLLAGTGSDVETGYDRL